MKFYPTKTVILLITSISLASFAGCGSKAASTAEKKEEQRQKMIKNAAREQREG